MRHLCLSILAVAGVVSFASPLLAAPAVTLAEASFSAGPGTDYGAGKKLPAGTHLDVIWCGTHDNWCLVDVHSKRGWLPMAALTFKVPHAVAFDDGGTTGGGIAPGPVGKPDGNPPVKMALPGGGGGGGIKFVPNNNYSVVKLP